MAKFKTLFHAQYLGQRILVHSNSEHPPAILQPDQCGAYFGRLLLRSTEQLTENELAIIAKLEGYVTNLGRKDYAEEGKNRINLYVKNNFGFSSELKYNTMCYLRSIGILVRFTTIDDKGNPITILEAEILAKEWAKIQEA